MRGKYLLYGALAAGLTLFVWQTISNAAIPWHTATMSEFQNDNAIVQAVKAAAPTNGVYFSNRGILAAVSFTPDMADKSKAMGPMMAKQIVLDLVVALILCLLVARLGVRSARETAMTLGLGALTVGMIKELSDWNWYGFGTAYSVVNVIDLVIMFALAGLVIGSIYRRQMRDTVVDNETLGVKTQGSYSAPRDSRLPVG
ncbi:MAG: hypothetical protein ABR585_05990 [Gemmatimonadaceae bacterium]